MENLNEGKIYSEQNNEQKISSFEDEINSKMRQRYISTAERKVLRKLAILAVTALLIVVVLFFWGLPILARIAGIVTFLPGGDRQNKSSDTIPPFPPRLESLPTATNSAKINLTGFAEPESSVEIFLNGTLAQKLVIGSEGKFEIENFNLTYGENKIQLKATDEAGNSSPVTEQQITFDNTQPELEISEPAAGSVFYGGQNLIKISGKTETGSTVLVNGFWAIVDQEGNFTLSYPTQVGENKLEVTAQDTAGNQTKKNLTIYYNP